MRKVQLRAPAGNMQAVEEALNAGADVVYIGFESPTNLRNVGGLNLKYEDAKRAVEMAHSKGKELYVAVNSYPQKDELEASFKTIDQAAALGVDAVIVSDIANMEYIAKTYPKLPIHCSVQTGSANAETINFWRDNFNAQCVVLPRVLTIEEIEHIRRNTTVELEAFVLGSLCTAYPGRCNMSQYLTGESTNTKGVCTSPKFLEFKEDHDDVVLLLNNKAISKIDSCKPSDSISECKGHNGSDVVKGKPDGWSNSFIVNKRHVCKGKYLNSEMDNADYAMHDHVILNTLGIVGRLIEAGINAFKIEGRQRPSAYSRNSTRVVREAIDRYYADPKGYKPDVSWDEDVADMFKEMAPSTGPYMGR